MFLIWIVVVINKLTIATRTSKLAIAQTNIFVNKLKSLHSDLEISLKEIVTKGDKWLETPLYEHGGKGLFVKELEHAILNGEADLAIHSLKDMPYELPPGLELKPVLERANPFDIMLSNKYKDIDSLPKGAIIGTSSLRRHWQLNEFRGDLSYKLLRGNIHTRVGKLLAGEYDAIILAAAGLERVDGIEVPYIYEIPEEVMIPAVGQGVLTAEFKSSDDAVKSLVSSLIDDHAYLTSTVERDLNRGIGGSCQTPIAGYASIEGDMVTLNSWVGDTIEKSFTSKESCHISEYKQLGSSVARSILDKGSISWR